MLRTLRSVFGLRKHDAAQLTLELDAAPRTADELLARLRTLGLRRITQCRLTRNRNVMVSFRGRDLRVHEGYLAAPEEVHHAIVAFVEGRTRGERRVAQRRIVSFRVETPPGASTRAPSRRERTRPDDQPAADRLTKYHAQFNAEHFHGALKAIPVRVSRRMRSRLGHYSAANANESGEIAISWRHLRRHGWDEALHTLLHEMVHQWQDESGHPLDHGRLFRAKAREVGIQAAAKREVTR
ncbi:MAG TPA: SprT-like domain-containing protein [Gemmatimonadaceae bacterium]|nr:SprT-like domain-containing protein [Gemmatimonadaceae bacterium]